MKIKRQEFFTIQGKLEQMPCYYDKKAHMIRIILGKAYLRKLSYHGICATIEKQAYRL